MRDAPARVLFLNSGILGHRTVGALEPPGLLTQPPLTFARVL